MESVTLTNFQCFGPKPVKVELEPDLTALIGANGSGKTAVCQALLRLFGITSADRQVRVSDFYVPPDELTAPGERSLTVEAVLTFPELDQEAGSSFAIPEFFHQMASTVDGALKCRIALQAAWLDDNTVDGSVTEERRVVHTFDVDYDDQWSALTAVDRGRIQMIYLPASRDGARQVSEFLRGRLWRAGRWSESFSEHVSSTAEALTTRFRGEPVVKVVEDTLTQRWQQLHSAGTDMIPGFEPLNSDLYQVVRNAELKFAPSPTGQAREAAFLSDGQRSLLHLALTATALDVEEGLVGGEHTAEFNLDSVQPPSLTIIAVEEPENSLAPFYLSRILHQVGELSNGLRAQAIVSSHSASVLSRIRPSSARYFRQSPTRETSTVRSLTLPASDSDEGKYLRQAVKAHPELYFARFVVLGEGDSEELVIPLLAEAMGVHIDRSFVAVVPLGGRHTNHFWRLLTDLAIPHATLLDLDYGRAGGGGGRIRDVCTGLLNVGIDPFEGTHGYSSPTDISDDMDIVEVKKWTAHLRKWNVFFSEPLDLDMSLLRCFWAEYTTKEKGELGPAKTDADEAVLGTDRMPTSYWNPTGEDEDTQRQLELRWYRYRFLSRSKPSTHLRVLSRMAPERLAAAPEELVALIKSIRSGIDG
ncbi:ATP-dependent nuclease [Nocardia elegans]|uniref:ATP-dependent nuclease n=1 Tax=Nocardia elegans TaxID=300029 RepID=UPI002B4B6E4F|nr:AAA family ATPase [Nocardia elegans]